MMKQMPATATNYDKGPAGPACFLFLSKSERQRSSIEYTSVGKDTCGTSMQKNKPCIEEQAS